MSVKENLEKLEISKGDYYRALPTSEDKQFRATFEKTT